MTTPKGFPPSQGLPTVAPATCWGWGLGLLMVAALGQVVAGRLVWADIPLQTDTGIWAYFAGRMLEGARLYSDLWESKPPGIFLTFALIERVSAVGGDRAFLWLDAVLTVAVCGVSYVVARRFAPRGPAVVAVCLLSVVLSHRVLADWGDNLEKFVALFEMAALGLVVSRRIEKPWLLIGVCCGLAAAFKQTGVLFLLIVVVGLAAGWPVLGQPRRGRALGLCVLGAAIPWIGILVWLGINESLGAFWRQVVVHDLGRATSAEHERWRILEKDHWSNVGRHLALALVLFGPALAACMAFWTRRPAPKSRESGPHDHIDGNLGLVAVYAIAATLIFVAAPHGYGHYLLQAAPPAAVLSAWAFGPPCTPRESPFAAVVLLIGVMAGAWQLGDHVQFLTNPECEARKAYRYRRDRVDGLVQVVCDAAPPGASVMLWPSDHAVSYYAGRRTPLEICQAIDIFGGRIRLLDPPLAEVLKRLQAMPPDIIVDWTPIAVQPSEEADVKFPAELLVPAGGFSLAEEPDCQHVHLEGRLLAPLKEWVRREYGGQVRYGDRCTIYFRGQRWREWQEYLRSDQIKAIN